MDREILSREDMVDLLGPRPFKEKHTYEVKNDECVCIFLKDFVAGTGGMEEDTTLPKGLESWNKPKEGKEPERAAQK